MHLGVGILPLIMLSAGAVHGAVWSVDDDLLDDPDADFIDIQSAIDTASHGDEILVHPGTYTGAGDQVVDMLGKSIHLHSTGNAEATVIDGQDARRGVLCGGGETESTLIEGFTIRNGFAESGGGVYCVNGNPTFVACVIEECTASDGAGGGVRTYQSDCTFDSCTVRDNSCTVDGGGMWMGFSDATLMSVTVSNNQAGDDGGGIFADGSGLNLLDCVISDNEANDDGGGVYISGHYQEPTFTGCTISLNRGSGNYAGGGGVYTYECDPFFIECVITGNTISGSAGYSHGGGVACYQSDATLQVCDLSGNTATGWGGGMWAYECDPVLETCTILGNSARNGGGLGMQDHSDIDLVLCEFQGNQAERGGAIRCQQFSDPHLTGSIVRDNVATLEGGGIFGDNGDIPAIDVSVFCNNTPDHQDVWSWQDLGGNCFADTCEDVNDDGLPDECQCLPDLDGDGTVSISDLLAVLDSWGCESCPDQDINGDGTIGIEDLLAIISMWGECSDTG